MCGEALPDTAGRPTVSSRATKMVHSASNKSQGGDLLPVQDSKGLT